MVKIFVVNLETSTDRMNFMKIQLDSFKVDYEFIKAVDGRKLTEEQLDEMCDMNKVRAWPDLLTPGMIGCSLSHYKVYQDIVSRRIPFATILEDDTLLTPDFPIIIEHLEKDFMSGKLTSEPILLYYQSREVVEFSEASKISLNKEFSLYHPIEIWRPITTAAYVITYECAKRLVDLIYPIKYPSDSWGVFYREGAIPGLRCVLPLVVESGFFKSDIGYELDKPFNRFVKALEAYHIFPIPQLLKKRRRRLAKKQNRYILSEKSVDW